jgi:hypothetical protein
MNIVRAACSLADAGYRVFPVSGKKCRQSRRANYGKKVLYLRDHETYLIGAHTATKFLAGNRSTATALLAWPVAQQFVRWARGIYIAAAPPLKVQPKL